MAGGQMLQLVRRQAPLKYTRTKISGGDRGTAQTIALMMAAVGGKEGVFHPEIRQAALQIVKAVPSRDQQGEITAVLQWVKSNIAFRGELGEMIQTPLVTLHLQAGDCDDQATLMAALLSVLGYKTRFRTVAADPAAPRAFSHVFLEIFQRKTGQWISLDSTVPNSYPGWKPPRVFRSQAWRPMGNTDTSNTTVDLNPTSKTAAVMQLLQPISQAVGDRIRYGKSAPTVSLDLNTRSSTAGGISPLWIYGGGAALLGAALWLSRRSN